MNKKEYYLKKIHKLIEEVEARHLIVHPETRAAMDQIKVYAEYIAFKYPEKTKPFCPKCGTTEMLCGYAGHNGCQAGKNDN